MNLLYKYVRDLVEFEAAKKNYTYLDIALAINCSESFIKKIHYSPFSKHYNLNHLFLLATEFEIDISELIPNTNSLKKLYKSEEKIEEILFLITNSIGGNLHE